MKRSQLDIVEHNPALAGKRFTLRHQPAILILAFYAEYPFLFSFFAFNKSDRPTDRYCQKDDYFVFYSFHTVLFDGEAYSLSRQLMLAKSCTKLEKMSTLFVVFFPDAHPLLICSILLTITSRTSLVTYEKRACSDVDISPFGGAPLGKFGSHWEYLALHEGGNH